MRIPVCFGAALAAVTLLCAQAFAQEKEWVRVWPCEADGAKTVSDCGGNAFPSTGENACIWFNFNGAGNWKRFKVKKGSPVIIRANGDSGPGACLGRVDFKLIEIEDEKRTEKFIYDGPTWSGVAPSGEPQVRLVYYMPQAGEFEIACTRGGFYVMVYQLREKPDMTLTEEKRARIIELIARLGSDKWREREEAQAELESFGPAILPFLDKEKNSDLLEVRIRVGKLMKKLTPVGESLSEEEMETQASELIGKLTEYVKANSFTCEQEPARNLALMGPCAVKPLLEALKSQSAHVRAAAVHALGRIGDAQAVPTIIKALRGDREEEVRFQAAAALIDFDAEEVKAALKEASEKDESERVCAKALESLVHIKSRQAGEPDEKPDDEE
jgi:hypothetical protein